MVCMVDTGRNQQNTKDTATKEHPEQMANREVMADAAESQRPVFVLGKRYT